MADLVLSRQVLALTLMHLSQAGQRSFLAPLTVFSSPADYLDAMNCSHRTTISSNNPMPATAETMRPLRDFRKLRIPITTTTGKRTSEARIASDTSTPLSQIPPALVRSPTHESAVTANWIANTPMRTFVSMRPGCRPGCCFAVVIASPLRPGCSCFRAKGRQMTIGRRQADWFRG